MNIPKLSIENHQFMIVGIALLLMSGIFSFITMPRSEDPMVSPPGTNVIVIYPGASPEDLEELVVDPIESEINELEDIKKLTSSARDGIAVIDVEFETGVNMDDKYSEVVQKVNGIRDDLPENVNDIDIVRWSISDVAILQVGVVSDIAGYRELEHEADLLQDELEKLPGVKKVETSAFPEQEVRISVDLERLAQFGITLGEIERAVATANVDLPGGYVDMGARRFTIKTSGAFESLDEIRRTVIRSDGDKVLYLDDIATVDFDYEDNNHFARINGERAVYVTVHQKERTNIFEVMDGINASVNEFEIGLPDGIHLERVFDQSESVSRRVSTFFSNLLQGLILVGAVVLLAASLRTSAIVILAIPMSILIGLGLLDLSDFGLQQMTIAGLVIALGLLVDNVIVVTDNVTRFMRTGMSAMEAAVQGTSQVGWAIISSTVTTVLAFVPIMLLPGITGDFIRGLPVTVIYALLASLLLSLTLTPYLSGKIIRAHTLNHVRRPRKMLDNFVAGPYRRTLDYAMKHPAIILITATAVFLGSLALFPVVGVSFFPKAEKPQFMINIDLPDGSSLDQTDSVTSYVESVLAERKDVRHWAANIGEGNPRIYYNVLPRRSAGNHAQVYVELKEPDGDVLQRAVTELRETFTGYPGAEIRVKEFEQGPPFEAPIAIRVIGENLETLKKIAGDVEEIINSVPGTINIYNPLATTRTDLRVHIDREKAARQGVSLLELDRTVRAAMAGLNITDYHDPNGKEYDVVMRLPHDLGISLSSFDRIHVASQSGALVPLRQMASVEFEASPTSINRYNLNRNVLVKADVEGATNANAATLQVIEKLDKYDWPRGYRYYVAGELESRQESFGGMGQAVILALIAIFAVLVLQFRSFIQPLIVFAAIPLAVIGSILALLVTGYTFSFTAFVGITSLVGIVINNSIILVDYVNQLRRDGTGISEAIMEAGQTRFAPIILTTLTTIGGLLPLTIQGGTMWAPMGWAIIGGLLVSTALTLLVVPVLYRLLSSWE